MARRQSKKKEQKSRPVLKGRPRTVRLSLEDDRWVDQQTHPEGFTGILCEAVRFYREHKDQERRTILEAIA